MSGNSRQRERRRPIVTKAPFTRYNRLSLRLYNRFDNRFDNRVKQTALFVQHSCQTGLYNRFDNRLYTRYNRLSNLFDNRFDNGFDNRLYRVYKHLPGCETGLTTGCIV